MTSVEYASLAELQRRDCDSNGTDIEAGRELARRRLAALTGRRSPAELLRELELRRHPDGSPRDPLIQTYAMCKHTRDPHIALLALWAMRIDGNW
jgi:hypothetical protein